MTLSPGARRWARLLPVPLVAAAALTSVGAPAHAATARTTFAQTAPVQLGDPDEYYENLTPMTVPETGTQGQASVFPSQIVIPEAVRITDLDVDLYGLSHDVPRDLDILLVGPGGQQALLMSDAGGTDLTSNYSVTFSDQAAIEMPIDSIADGATYRPTNYGVDEAMPAPAPAISGSTALSVFNGTIAAGIWKLFVFDDLSSDVGSLDGWSITLESETAPYPSQITVSNIGAVTDVNVALNNLTSTYPDDADFLLVGPQGQQATLMSDVGGGGNVSNLALVLDDEAATDLPDGSPLVSGTFRPTNIDGEEDLYPAPAPPVSGATALSTFDGTNPNGAWRLFASDTVGGDYTSISGWSLDIEWTDSAAPSGTVTVAGGAAVTRTTAVTLNLTATDPAPGAGVTQMRFSNDGKSFSAYQPYAATAAWTLATGDGTKTVYAQFKDGIGNESPVVSDTITLDTTGPSADKVKPKKNATGVSPKTKVKVFASEALASNTVTAKSVVLKKGSKKVKAKVSYKAGKDVIILKPKKPLAPGKYTVTVSTKVTDTAGNPFDAKSKPGAQKLTWKFTV